MSTPIPAEEDEIYCVDEGFPHRGEKHICITPNAIIGLRKNALGIIAQLEKERDALKAQLTAYQILLDARCWGAAVGACAEDYPDIAARIEKHDKEKS